MQTDILEAVQRKLKIVEKEADFNAHEPPPPRGIQLVSGFVLLVMWVVHALLSAFTGDWKLATTVLLGIVPLQLFLSYLGERRLYRMYSTAREIIGLYKESGEKP